MEPSSRCNNAIHVLNYFKKLGLSETAILDGLDVDKKYISNPHNWITVKDWYKIIDNCQRSAPLTTLDDWHKIGFNLKDSEESKLFKMITKLVGVKNMYKLVPKYTNSFNTYMKINLCAIGSDYADYTIKTDESVISKGIGLMVRYTSGVCSIIPYILYHEPATVNILYDQARLKNIIEQLYCFFDLKYSEKEEYVFVNSQKIGRRIQLLKSHSNNEIYSNRYSFDKPYNAVLILDDVTIDGRILLHKDHIFDAPYGRLVFKWKNKSRILNLFNSSGLKNDILPYLNEQIFLAEQRYFESEKLRAREKGYIAQLKFTLNELASIEETERRSIAEDLHDSVSQTLAVGLSKLKNIILERALHKDNEFIELQATLEQALKELRSLSTQISPPILSLLGLEDALEELSSEFSTKYGIRVRFFNEIQTPFILDDTLKTILYRSVRELFANVIKHSKAKKVQLFINVEDGILKIDFEDNGIGFDNSMVEKRQNSHFGLFSINERIKILDGQFKIDSTPGFGTNVCITVPI